MVGIDDIVITGLGCITPIGHGRHAFWQGLSCGRCATQEILVCQDDERVFYGAPIKDFDGKQYVVPRKALKLMGHEVQISYAAAHLAWEDAGLASEIVEPDRIGVSFGSELLPGDVSDISPAIRNCIHGSTLDSQRWGSEFSKAIYPLWMLRYLPNMPPCHVAIAVDARGPNNTIAQEEVSGLLALSEAVSVMQRGDADLMIVGAVGARLGPTRLAYRMPGFYLESAVRTDDNSRSSHSHAFDVECGGIVPGEAAIVLILEKRRHAVTRRARLYGTLMSTSSRCGRPMIPRGGSSNSLASAARAALRDAELSPQDLACISAQGYSHPLLDRNEAAAIESVARETPVTAYSSYYGTPGAASGLLNLAAGMLATGAGKILPTLGHVRTDPLCPVNVCRKEQAARGTCLMQLSFTMQGQAAAAIVDCQSPT